MRHTHQVFVNRRGYLIQTVARGYGWQATGLVFDLREGEHISLFQPASSVDEERAIQRIRRAIGEYQAALDDIHERAWATR